MNWKKRLARLESYLGIKKDGKLPPAKWRPRQRPTRGGQGRRQPAPATDKDAYNLGIRLYKQKSYQAARDRFQEVLDKHPKSRYAASSQFWVGKPITPKRNSKRRSSPTTRS